MRLKYFFRGLGTGILVASVILTISYQNRANTLSNDEIIAKASELGMVMENTTTIAGTKDTKEDVSGNSEESNEENKEQQVSADAETSKDANESDSSQTDATEEADTTKNQNENTKTAEVKTVSITINKGSSAMDICTELKNAGLIADAADFKNFIANSNATELLETGVFTFNSGAEYEEILKVLTTKQK